MRWQNIALLCLIAVVATSCAKSPSIVVEPETIELGILSPGEIVEDTVWIKNAGEGLLSVTTRSGCDCIELESAIFDSINPGDSAAMAFVYYAYDSAMFDTSTILFTSNDPDKNVGKIVVTATIQARKLARTDSTITLIPFGTNDPQLKSASNSIVNTFFSQAQKKLGFTVIPPNKIVQDLLADNRYGKRPTEELIRKWALMDSIRWIVVYQLAKTEDGTIQGQSSLIDGFAEFPIPIKFESSVDNAGAVFLDSIAATFDDLGQRYRNALMQGMQKKWAHQRKEILNKPLPKIEFIDVRTGDTLTGKSVDGKILLMHFFGTDCEHCEDEAEWMAELIKSDPENLVVWGVSVDMGEDEEVEKFAIARNLPYPIVLPTEKSYRRFTRIYGGATPQTIIADRKMIVREFFVGFNASLTKRLEATLQALGSSAKSQP